MGRSKVYASNAERQRAYRRRRAAHPHGGTAERAARQPRPPSRPRRLAAVLEAVEELRREYEAWLDSLPEALRDGDQATRLTETIEQLDAAHDLLSEIQPPLGYGRD